MTRTMPVVEDPPRLGAILREVGNVRGPLRDEYEAGRRAARVGQDAALARREELAEALTGTPLERFAGHVLPVAETVRETAEDAAARRDAQEAARAALWSACVPGEYADASLAVLDAQQDPDGRVSKWWESGHRGLVLLGPSRHGKSFAAYAAAHRARAAGVTAVAWSVSALAKFTRVPAVHERNDEVLSAQRARQMDATRRATVLILDDLGREGALTDHWTDVLYGILEYRITHPGLRTIVTANGPGATNAAETDDEAKARKFATLDGIRGRYGDPIFNRMVDDAVLAWIEGTPRAGYAKWDI